MLLEISNHWLDFYHVLPQSFRHQSTHHCQQSASIFTLFWGKINGCLRAMKLTYMATLISPVTLIVHWSFLKSFYYYFPLKILNCKVNTEQDLITHPHFYHEMITGKCLIMALVCSIIDQNNHHLFYLCLKEGSFTIDYVYWEYISSHCHVLTL